MKAAFLHLNETLVKEHMYLIYNPTEDSNTMVLYPDHVATKYPKPVFKWDRRCDAVAQGDNDAKTHTIGLDWTRKHTDFDRIVFGVAWVDNVELIVEEVDRAGEIYFDLAADNLDAGINGRLGKAMMVGLNQ